MNATWRGTRFDSKSTPTARAAATLGRIAVELQLMAWAIIFDDPMAHEPENVALMERHARQLESIERWANGR